LVNAVVRPVLTMLSCPLIVVTLGLFLLVINAAMLGITSWLSTRLDLGFHVDGFVAALLGGLVIGVVSTLLTLFVGRAAQG
jgi:putative membrane protein